MFEPTTQRVTKSSHGACNTVAYYELDDDQHISVRFACMNYWVSHIGTTKGFRDGVQTLFGEIMDRNRVK